MENKGKATPGPWHTEGQVVYDANERRIAITAGAANAEEQGRAENAANAKLIAAAPTLVATLGSVEREINDLLARKCEGGHPDIDDQTRRDLQAILGGVRVALAAGRLP